LSGSGLQLHGSGSASGGRPAHGSRRLLTPLARVPVLKATGRGAVRRAAMTTSRWRPLPDFLLIGAKRGGSTSLFRYLLDHPQVLPMFPSARRLPLAEDMKGVHYFDCQWGRGPSWYRSHFASARARSRAEEQLGLGVVTGESSPFYLFQPRAAQRAAATVPQARIVVLLRDPVERTFSHWKEQRRRTMELLGFPEALQAEAGRLAGEKERLMRDDRAVSPAYEHQGYVEQSRYVEGLRRWYDHFDRSQVLVVWSDEFYRSPQPTYDAVCRHLGLAPQPVADPRAWNSASSESPLPDALRSELAQVFAPLDDELRELVGQPLGWAPSS